MSDILRAVQQPDTVVMKFAEQKVCKENVYNFPVIKMGHRIQ